MAADFSRRDFAKLAGLAAVGATAGAKAADKAAVDETLIVPDRHAPFPKNFLWGTATSSYQIEGAVDEDGRGKSIWDTFSHTPGKIEDGTTGDRANEHYHRYKDDVALIKALGVKAYRFSIAWPRVFPEGSGQPNPKGLDFYNRLVDELLANGIEPYATLYHWDLPQALQDRLGGWQSSDTSKAFADYAAYVAQRLTDRVKNIFTVNEVGRFVNFGYGWGIDAPGLRLPAAQLNQVRHHVALAHGLAVQAIRASGRAGTRVGAAENIAACVPAIATPENIRAAEIATRELNAGFLGVVLEENTPTASSLMRGRTRRNSRRGTEDHQHAERFRRSQYLCAAILRHGVRPRAGLPRTAVSLLVPAHEFGMAPRRPRGDLLGTAPRRKDLEHRQYLYQRERHLLGGQARCRRRGLRPRSHHVPAQLPDPDAARGR